MWQSRGGTNRRLQLTQSVPAPQSTTPPHLVNTTVAAAERRGEEGELPPEATTPTPSEEAVVTAQTTQALQKPSLTSRYKEEFDELERLGRGGFGSVWKVRNKLDGCVYAVKRIRFHFRNGGKLSRKLQREVQTIAQLDHPNVVRYHVAWIEHAEKAESPRADSEDSRTVSAPPAASGKGMEDDDDDEADPPSVDDDDAEDEEEHVREEEEEEFEEPYNAEEELKREGRKEEDTELQFEFQDDPCAQQVPLSPVSPLPAARNAADGHRGGKKKKSAPPADEWSTSTLFIQMHLYPETLANWLSRPGRGMVNRRESADILRQIAEALCYMHGKGIIHRDLKPANIFLTPLASPKREGAIEGEEPRGPGSPLGLYGAASLLLVSVGDFGLATFAGSPQQPSAGPTPFGSPPSPYLIPGQPQPSQSLQSPVWMRPRQREHSMCIPKREEEEEEVFVAASAPRPGGVTWMPSKHTSGIGTSLYASPEQISRGFYNEKTDIFSLGIICFELFSPPFETQMERSVVLEAVREGKLPVAFEEAWPHESAFIRSCVSCDLADRPSAVDVLSSELWAPEIISPLPTQQQQQIPQQPISPMAWRQDTVVLPRNEVENMRRRIAELEASVAKLTLQQQLQQQQIQQHKTTQSQQQEQPLISVPPARAARGDSTAIMHVSPLSLFQPTCAVFGFGDH